MTDYVNNSFTKEKHTNKSNFFFFTNQDETGIATIKKNEQSVEAV